MAPSLHNCCTLAALSLHHHCCGAASVVKAFAGVLPPNYKFGVIGLSTLMVYARAVAELGTYADHRSLAAHSPSIPLLDLTGVSDTYKPMLVNGGITSIMIQVQ